MPNLTEQPTGRLVDYPTKTSDWCLVIQTVSTTTADIWFGSLCPTVQEPASARLVLSDATGATVGCIAIDQTVWQRPFSRLKQRFYALHRFTGLVPGNRYRVRFDRGLPGDADRASRTMASTSHIQGQQIWQDVCSGEFTTLPERLPVQGNGYFTLGLASCYFRHRDEGQAAAAYKALYYQGQPEDRPDVTCFTGDQVYLDIGLDSLSLRSRDIWERIATDYERQWQALGEFFRCGGTWMLPDDHEYWNDYPFYHSLIPTLWPLHKDSVRRAWRAAARDGVQRVQQCPKVATLDIGEDLSLCWFDSRSYRHKRGFTDADSLAAVESWARNLTTPGVLVCSQNLLDKPGGMERNLTDFTRQYQRLISALASSGHDIVSLSGDVHFGRIAQVRLGEQGGMLTEVVASPLSNLTGLNGIATAGAGEEPDRLTVPDFSAPIDYLKGDFFVGTEAPESWSSYPKVRTREHFMTVGFCRRLQGGITMRVQAWRVRDRDEQGVPKAEFARAFVTELS